MWSCCHKLDTIVDFVGHLLFPIVVGTIQPFEVLTCCCCLNSCWWCCHSVCCHSSCCWSKRRWRPNTVETKRLRLNIQLLSTFSCWHSHRRSRLLFNKMLNHWNKKSQQKHVECKVAQSMLSKTSCWQKSRKSTCWSGMLKIHNLWRKKRCCWNTPCWSVSWLNAPPWCV